MHTIEVERVCVLVTTLNKAIGELYVGGFTIFNMKLIASQLRDFIKASSNIRPDRTFPGTSYFYLSRNRIVKTSIHTFCEMEIECDIEIPVLLEQQKLQSFLSATKNDILTLSIGKNITYSDSKLTATQAIENVSIFPAIPTFSDVEAIEIDQEFIDAISIAKNFVSDNENAAALLNVHVKDNFVAATDGFIMYYETLPGEKLPNIILSKDEISMMQAYSSGSLYDTENRYFFKSGKFTYSFTKTENKTPPFERIIEFTNAAGNDFVINKAELQSFCELSNAYTGSLIPSCILTGAGLKFTDTTGEEINYPLTIDADIEFSFNSRYLLPALKALPVAELKCSMITHPQKALVIKDENFICSLMGFMPKN